MNKQKIKELLKQVETILERKNGDNVASVLMNNPETNLYECNGETYTSLRDFQTRNPNKRVLVVDWA